MRSFSVICWVDWLSTSMAIILLLNSTNPLLGGHPTKATPENRCQRSGYRARLRRMHHLWAGGLLPVCSSLRRYGMRISVLSIVVVWSRRKIRFSLCGFRQPIYGRYGDYCLCCQSIGRNLAVDKSSGRRRRGLLCVANRGIFLDAAPTFVQF